MHVLVILISHKRLIYNKFPDFHLKITLKSRQFSEDISDKNEPKCILVKKNKILHDKYLACSHEFYHTQICQKSFSNFKT